MMNARRITANPSVKWAEFRLIYALDRLRLALKAYDPDQPRAPGGTEEGGQWIAVDGPLDLIQLAGGFKDFPGTMKVQDFIAQMCKGQIRREFPGDYLNHTLDSLLEAKKNGDSGASKCLKLLREDRFRK